MPRKILAFIIILVSCSFSQLKAQKLADTTANDYGKLLEQREKQSAAKRTDSLGTLITTINFEIKTNDTSEYKNGIISDAEIGYKTVDENLNKLIGKDDTVIHQNRMTIIIDYPLTNECKFELTSKNGFTRKQLLEAIRKKYHDIYAEEEKSATVKTIPPDKRTTLYNRNQTNGKYGIWGHDIDDLVLTGILVYQTANGDIFLSLDIES